MSESSGYCNHAYTNDISIANLPDKKMLRFSPEVDSKINEYRASLGSIDKSMKSTKLLRESYFHDYRGNVILEKLLAAKEIQPQENEDDEVRGTWDVFRYSHQKEEFNSDKTFIITSKKVIKIFVSIVMFLAVISLTLISKSCLFLIISNINNAIQMDCTTEDGDFKCWRISATPKNHMRLRPSLGMQVKWIWALIITVCTPYLLITLRCMWRICFKKNKRFTWDILLIVLVLESLQSVGMALFIFNVLPYIDSLRGEALMFGGAFIPAILKLIDKTRDSGKPIYKIVIDVLSVVAQASILIVWPMIEWNAGRKDLAIYIPVSLFLISLNWWENYVGKFTWLGARTTRNLLKVKRLVRSMHTYIYMVIGIWKCVLIISLASIIISEFDIGCLKLMYFQETDTFSCEMFSNQAVNSTLITYKDNDSLNSPFWIAFVQIASCLLCYLVARNACKIMLQVTNFAVPLVLSPPLTIAFFLGNCEVWNKDNTFNWLDPKVMFWTCDVPNNGSGYVSYLITEYYFPIILAWWLSYMWVTAHIWYPNVERLVRTEKLFVKTYFCDIFLQLSITLNRRNDYIDGTKKRRPEVRHSTILNPYNNVFENSIQTHTVPMIYVCATMWHETDKEMRSILTSLFRLDLDQSVRSYAQLFDVIDPNYYEFEAHIFFDDAFDYYVSEDDYRVNSYVNGLIKQMNTAVNNVHKIQLRLSPPELYNTPYGGKMMWIMPGNNKLVVHMKNKEMIRHRKRWSQVMYMYYFLGYHLLGTSDSPWRKQVIADNTYLLALDGDVDFKPEALQLLVDRMKKSEKVGAACGRIHPRGSGPMLWYQQFEYSISHWLQKATEHVIGCVLCSPGCFSLFRASALMDENVMRKYAVTAQEARHFVQYDQGEDRWLCTLLLQRGYRVEYCAASDAFTFAPEGFHEFFNQRRRWIPSTMANIFDVLQNWRNIININEDISGLFIFYQTSLFLLTLLTPGTIFLLIVGAISTAFPTITLIESLIINIVPIIIFVVICFFLSTNSQLAAAGILTCTYTLLMILVVIGLVLQMVQEGLCSPTTIFFLFMIAIFTFAGLLHPLEFANIIHGPVYLLTAPSSGMLMIIYAICNMNKISWGTRESNYQNAEKKAQEEEIAARNPESKKWWSFLKKDKGFNLGDLFKCICCQKLTDETEDRKMNSILDKLEKIEKCIEGIRDNKEVYLDTDESSIEDIEPPLRKEVIRKSSNLGRRVSFVQINRLDEKDSIDGSDEDGITGWQHDLQDVSVNICLIAEKEREFWEELIEKYLHPIEKNEEKQLKDEENLIALRNKCCLFFFLCNGLFTIIIFTLQYINIRNIDSGSSGLVIPLPCYSKSGFQLKIEPLSMLFMIMFGVILSIQFLAMVYHRLSTLHHIIASTHINCLKLNQSETSYMNIYSNMELVKDMINQDKEDDERSIMSAESQDLSPNQTPPRKRRRTVAILDRKKKTKPVNNSLADVFLRSFLKLAQDIERDNTGPNLDQENRPLKSKNSLKFERKKSIQAYSALKDNKETVLNKMDRINDIIKHKKNSIDTQIPVPVSSNSETVVNNAEYDNEPIDDHLSPVEILSPAPAPSNVKRKNNLIARLGEQETGSGRYDDLYASSSDEISDSPQYVVSPFDIVNQNVALSNCEHVSLSNYENVSSASHQTESSQL